MRSLKMLTALLTILALIGFTGGSSVLMASHITHFASDKGPGLPQNESGCTKCHAAGNLQCSPDGPLFADDKHLETTEVCDPCHSPGGAFPGASGLDDPDVGAKANWDTGVYNTVLADWQQATAYEVGDVVEYSTDPWRCTSAHVSGSSWDPVNWALVPIWQGSTQYQVGDLVVFGGNVLRCTTAHVSQVMPSGDAGKWETALYGEESLQTGKDKWCATCHDDAPANSKADGLGIDAPNVVGADISDPADPRIVFRLNDVGYVFDVDVSGRVAYLAQGAKGITTVDVADPYNPVVSRGMEAFGNNSLEAVIAGNYAAISGGLRIHQPPSVTIIRPRIAQVIGGMQNQSF